MDSKRCNVAVLASGTGSNFEAIVRACSDPAFPARVACLITDNPEAGALDIAAAADVPSIVVDPGTRKASLAADVEERIVAACREHDAGLVALAGFMRILTGPLLEHFEGRVMNIHPSLLPSFKGLQGARQALDYGVKVAGCTVHFVTADLDSGAIILQAAVPVESDDDVTSLQNKIHAQEHRIYVEAVRAFAEDRIDVDGRRVRIK